MRIVTLTLIAAAALLAQSKDRNGAPAQTHAASEAANPAGVPKGATRVESNLYRYVDAQGKTWLYRQTPFGVSKWEDKPSQSTRAVDPPRVVVRDLGDRVEFQRQTPFGISKWTTKKTELTEEENALIAVAAEASEHTALRSDKSTERQEKQ
jgi:hypothetical protein